MISLENCTKYLGEKLTPILYDLFQKIKNKTYSLSHFMKAIISLRIKPDKDITERKLQASISHQLCIKTPNTILESQIQQYINSVIHHDKVQFILRMQGCFI